MGTNGVIRICKNCRFWELTTPCIDPAQDYGECRRKAPTNKVERSQYGNIFESTGEITIIQTNEEYWCGEWERRAKQSH